MNISATEVFYWNWVATEKILINQGGTSSSKTYSIMQILMLKASTEPGLVITVTGESIPNLKKGAYRDAKAIYATTDLFQKKVKSWNETDRIITFSTGSIIEFVSNLTEQSAKNGKRDMLFVNEANGISWPIFFQLAIRTRGQIYIDYNPTAPFWAHDNLIDTTPETNDLTATVKLIVSWHVHNGFLSEDEHRKIEGIKDPELHRVYARGLTGNLTGLIYPNWKECEFPGDVDPFYGIDYGYENDPTALVKVARIGNNIYLDELAYQTGDIPPRTIVQLLKADDYHDQPLYSEHDPDMIRQLRQLDILCIAARKGQGSISAGIQKMKEYNVFYTPRSHNIREERKRYMWLIDPDTGKPTNTPKPGWDHILDAARYAVYSHFYRGEN